MPDSRIAARAQGAYPGAQLIAELRENSRPVAEIVPAIRASVQQFSASDQCDDLTLLAARR